MDLGPRRHLRSGQVTIAPVYDPLDLSWTAQRSPDRLVIEERSAGLLFQLQPGFLPLLIRDAERLVLRIRISVEVVE